MWDVNTDIDQLLDDYYTHFFGPAAVPMKQVGERIEAMLQATHDRITWQPFFIDWTPTYPPARVAALNEYLNQAEQLANTPEIKTRVRLYRILHNYMTANLNVYALKAQGKYAEALTELEKLPKLTTEAEAIQKGLLPPDPGWVLNDGPGVELSEERADDAGRPCRRPARRAVGDGIAGRAVQERSDEHRPV